MSQSSKVKSPRERKKTKHLWSLGRRNGIDITFFPVNQNDSIANRELRHSEEGSSYLKRSAFCWPAIQHEQRLDKILWLASCDSETPYSCKSSTIRSQLIWKLLLISCWTPCSLGRERTDLVMMQSKWPCTSCYSILTGHDDLQEFRTWTQLLTPSIPEPL